MRRERPSSKKKSTALLVGDKRGFDGGGAQSLALLPIGGGA